MCRAVFRNERQGGPNWVSQNKGGAKSLSVCTSTHEARGVRGHAPPGSFGIFEVLRLYLVHSWKQ